MTKAELIEALEPFANSTQILDSNGHVIQAVYVSRTHRSFYEFAALTHAIKHHNLKWVRHFPPPEPLLSLEEQIVALMARCAPVPTDYFRAELRELLAAEKP